MKRPSIVKKVQAKTNAISGAKGLHEAVIGSGLRKTIK